MTWSFIWLYTSVFFLIIPFIMSCFISFWIKKNLLVLLGLYAGRREDLLNTFSNYFLDRWKHFIYTISGQALQHWVRQDKNINWLMKNLIGVRLKINWSHEYVLFYTFHILTWLMHLYVCSKFKKIKFKAGKQGHLLLWKINICHSIFSYILHSLRQ